MWGNGCSLSFVTNRRRKWHALQYLGQQRLRGCAGENEMLQNSRHYETCSNWENKDVLPLGFNRVQLLVSSVSWTTLERMKCSLYRLIASIAASLWPAPPSNHIHSIWDHFPPFLPDTVLFDCRLEFIHEPHWIVFNSKFMFKFSSLQLNHQLSHLDSILRFRWTLSLG